MPSFARGATAWVHNERASFEVAYGPYILRKVLGCSNFSIVNSFVNLNTCDEVFITVLSAVLQQLLQFHQNNKRNDRQQFIMQFAALFRIAHSLKPPPALLNKISILCSLLFISSKACLKSP